MFFKIVNMYTKEDIDNYKNKYKKIRCIKTYICPLTNTKTIKNKYYFLHNCSYIKRNDKINYDSIIFMFSESEKLSSMKIGKYHIYKIKLNILHEYFELRCRESFIDSID